MEYLWKIPASNAYRDYGRYEFVSMQTSWMTHSIRFPNIDNQVVKVR